MTPKQLKHPVMQLVCEVCGAGASVPCTLKGNEGAHAHRVAQAVRAKTIAMDETGQLPFLVILDHLNY